MDFSKKESLIIKLLVFEIDDFLPFNILFINCLKSFKIPTWIKGGFMYCLKYIKQNKK